MEKHTTLLAAQHSSWWLQWQAFSEKIQLGKYELGSETQVWLSLPCSLNLE